MLTDQQRERLRAVAKMKYITAKDKIDAIDDMVDRLKNENPKAFHPDALEPHHGRRPC